MGGTAADRTETGRSRRTGKRKTTRRIQENSASEEGEGSLMGSNNYNALGDFATKWPRERIGA
jgi:hypothetical protein